MSHRLKHLRKLKLHALEHNHHHSKLRHVAEQAWEEEKHYWPLVLGVLVAIGVGLLWNYKGNLVSPTELRPAAPALYTQGYEKGALTTQVLGQAQKEETIQTQDSPMITATPVEGLAKSLVTSTALSKTGASTPVETRLLQKSLLTTFYLGETTNILKGALENDTKLLSEIENALSLDLFQYLNQSVDRPDALEDHLDLLMILEDRAIERQNELAVNLEFLENQRSAQEQLLEVHEDNFFTQLDRFQGTPAQDELASFVQIQEQQTQVQAKIGAYETLRSYYDYYQPLLQTRIAAIRANRDALIAGVKVVDIPGMDLGLILEKEG